MDRVLRNKIVRWVQCKWEVMQAKTPDGMVEQSAIDKFVRFGCASIHRWCKDTEWSGADAVWAALVILQRRNVIKQSIRRKHKGGAEVVDWQWQAVRAAGWSIEVARLETKRKFEMLQKVVVQALWRREVRSSSNEEEDGERPTDKENGEMEMGFQVKKEWVNETLRSLNRRFCGEVGAHLYHTIVAWCALQGFITGDIGRRKVGGARNETWWPQALEDLRRENHITAEIATKVAAFLETGRIMEEAMQETRKAISNNSDALWVIDICCGSKSRMHPAITALEEVSGREAIYIGLDMCPSWWDGNTFQIPEIVGDVLEEECLPTGEMMKHISNEFGLCLSNLVHVFMSTPCQTNSRADASNRNKMCGYRDWHAQHCPPLKIGQGKGKTTPEHHALAVTHDQLERKVILGMVAEAREHRLSFSAENPAGAMARKKHMQVFVEAKRGLRCHKVNYCAFGGWYLKATHIFHNMASFSPRGNSGNGLCSGKGRQGVAACPVGQIEGGRLKHKHTIGRESHKEYKDEKVSRKKAKNAIPELLTKEMVETAFIEWASEIEMQQRKKRKR